MKRLLRILVLIIITALLFTQTDLVKNLFRTHTAYAVGDLTVDWGGGVLEGQPIFTINNMTPGDEESHTVSIHNGATSSRPVGVRGILTSETASLSDVLDIIISEEGTDLYGGSTGSKTLAQFFTDSSGPDGISLSTLGPGDDANYTFKVLFKPESGNEFQNASVVFDIKIGVVAAIPAECDITDLSGKNIIFGTLGNDVIHGTNKEDIIFGLEGNDKLSGGNDNDCIVGGEGNDELRGENSADTLIGNGGNDLIIGGNGVDNILGGGGNDKIRGENGDDTIDAGAGNDIVTGGNGDDQIDGGDGNDEISAENGTDVVNGGNDNDTLNGGAGNDTLKGDGGADNANGLSGTDTCNAETELNCEL